MRETVEISKLKNWANAQLKRTDKDATKQYKRGICFMIERVLFDADNYKGFNCIYWLEQGFDEWLKDGCPDFPEKQKYIEGNGHMYNRYYY